MTMAQRILKLEYEIHQADMERLAQLTWSDKDLICEALRLAAQSAGEPPIVQQPADWSALPRDLYVTSVNSDGIVFDVQCCSVPMAIGPEVRYSLAAISVPPGDQAKSASELLDLLLDRINFDGMDPNTFTIAELRRAI